MPHRPPQRARTPYATPAPSGARSLRLSRIDILHPHARTPEQARTIVDDIAATLRQRYGLATEWAGDAIRLSGPGIQGEVEMQPGQVRVVAELGFLFSAMKGVVEDEIRRVLREKLD